VDKKPRAFNITYYVPNALSGGISEDVEQEHALDCFYYWSVKCFPSELTVPFWQQDILHEPATRHAMMAMGILHEIYRHKMTGPPSTQRRIAAMQHYGKAIQSLLSQNGSATSNNKMAISLLACLLFVCLEVSQGHYKSGLAHLQSGFKLFQGVVGNQQQTLQNNDLRASESILRSLFVRLMCQITHFDLVDCARFLGLLDVSTESSTWFANLGQARERFVAILSKVLSRRHAAEQNGDAMDEILAEELLEIDQWILVFNIYLTHSNTVLQTCDCYILGICAFFLKFRLTMDSRLLARASDATEMDLAHIASLGDILFEASQSSTTMIAEGTISACPLHRFFLDDDDDNDNDSTVSLSEQSLFPFISVFCSLFVSSIYSPDAAVRRKAQDTVSKICCCGKGWDQGLTVYIASLICPGDNRMFTSDDSFYDDVISTDSRSLLGLLRLFNSF
jgi:hypothetical protein